MILELHTLQNYPPHCLNRDDHGRPKSCDFGGVRRARISSQCLKRAVRMQMRDVDQQAAHAVRSRRLIQDVLVPELRNAELGLDPAEALKLSRFALAAAGLQSESDGTTQYLLFVPEQPVRRLAGVILEHAAGLTQAVELDKKGKAKLKKKLDGLAADAAAAMEAATEAVFKVDHTADLALFGRMIADRPDRNIDGATQFAHAISTSEVANSNDFFTAVDDLQRADSDEGSGAGMLGDVGFNSACFYGYTAVDAVGFHRNMNDGELTDDAASITATLDALRRFLNAAVTANPSAKQNSMSAQTRPSLVLAIAQAGQHQSLANAFACPVDGGGGDLVERSAAALLRHRARVRGVYGEAEGTRAFLIHTLDMADLSAAEALETSADLAGLVDKLIGAAEASLAAAIEAEAALLDGVS